jgi:hypothetical protein
MASFCRYLATDALPIQDKVARQLIIYLIFRKDSLSCLDNKAVRGRYQIDKHATLAMPVWGSNGLYVCHTEKKLSVDALVKPTNLHPVDGVSVNFRVAGG